MASLKEGPDTASAHEKKDAPGWREVLVPGCVVFGMLALSCVWGYLCVFVWKLDGEPYRFTQDVRPAASGNAAFEEERLL